MTINLNSDTDVINTPELIAAGAQLIDVREPDEFAAGTITGAINIPLQEFLRRLPTFDTSVPLAILCRSGNRSGQATEIFREAGFQAVNLQGGMLAWDAHHLSSDTLLCQQFYLDCLSQASYLIIDKSTQRAVVVDPTRDVQQYIDTAKIYGAKIELVLETHFHADFLSGHLELAHATGATIGYGAHAQPEFPTRLFADGETYSLGTVQLEIRHTPGHTPESISIVVREHANDAVPYAVLTGDTMFIGDVGRPDLLVSVGHTSNELGHMLYNSLHQKLLTLPDATRVLPAHGAGSACGKNLSTETMSTIGEQRLTNYALLVPNVDAFIDIVTEGQPSAPSYFIYDAQLNGQNRAVLDEHAPPQRLSLTEALNLQHEGVSFIDTRDAQFFATGYLKGSINVGLQGRYAEYAGAVIAPTEKMVIVTEPGQELEAKVRLARIGYDNVLGWLSINDLIAAPQHMLQASRLTPPQFHTKTAAIHPLQIVDVRSASESHLGSFANAINIPIAEIQQRLNELDPTIPTIVFCAGGYRSSIAASVLRRAGFTDVSDVLGGFEAIRA